METIRNNQKPVVKNKTNTQQAITDMWHRHAPETNNYEICPMHEATHVLFTKSDISLAGEDAKGLRPDTLYTLHIYEGTGDFYIIDDNNDTRIGFDLFIPCDYFKLITPQDTNAPIDNVISLNQYREWKALNR